MDEQQDREDLEQLLQLKQRPSRLNARPIGSVVRQLVTQRGYGQTQARADLVAQWKIAVGEQLAACCRPGNISRGVLQIHADNASAAHELQFLKSKILRHLQQTLPQMNIKRVRILNR